jgi:hypothetical protein
LCGSLIRGLTGLTLELSIGCCKAAGSREVLSLLLMAKLVKPEAAPIS